jgi:hypothetical protein
VNAWSGVGAVENLAERRGWLARSMFSISIAKAFSAGNAPRAASSAQQFSRAAKKIRRCFNCF